MSVNISLGDTPGVSAYFDGQPIQDELEAEVRREEERQEKELRDLLATELEDFEEDFLSDSNSEEDSVNVSRVSRASNNSHRVRQNEQMGALQQASEKLVRLAPDPSGNRQLDDTGHIVDLANDAYYTPISKHRSGPVNPQHLLHEHPQNLLRQQHHHQLQSRHPEHHPFHQYNQDSNQNNQGQFVPNSQGHELQGHQLFPSNDKDGDDWMMRVQQTHTVTTSTSSPHPPQPIHHHQQQQQQQHQFYPPIPHPVKSGMVETPPLSLPNNLHSIQQQAFHSPVANSAISKIVPKSSTPNLPNAIAKDNLGHKAHRASDNPDDYDNYQVQYKSKSKKNDVNENDFYIQNENVEFFRAEGDEEKRSYDQLEVLYRVRGRELEDLTWKLKQAEEEVAKESRMYKHKLALANGDLEGGQESLRQCQTLLQQSKSDLTESQALVRSLETQVASLKEVKEELIKKLQVAESTIENLSHQCEELQQSESLSRMRNEHENVVASLSQRFERELLSVKEKLDETKNNLEMKHDETVWLKKQLADSTKELEQAQISRGETINRLAKSLEDSQRQCQTLLEQSSSQELASLRVKLQQTTASKSVSEETCIGLQGEIKELKEQLSMFEAASALGAVTSTSVGIPSHSKGAGTGLDDSMTDLGIKKTLDFDTPSSTPKLADTSSLEELVTSLRSELEKCLHSNRQKRSEIAGKTEEIHLLKEELQLSQSKSQDLEKTCVDQKIKLKDLESLMSNSNGESILEVRLRRDLDALTKEKTLLLEDIEDYKKRVEEVGASEAKLTEINTELSAQIAQMVSDFDSDKATALDRCQRTLEEVNHLSMNNMRTELESRLESEKGMMAECHRMELGRAKDQLNAAQEEAHSLKSLYIKTCDEMKKQEEEMRSTIREEVEEELASVSRCKEVTKETALVQEEKDKRLCAEESFAKEKEIWNEKEDLYQKEIKASKDTIAQINKSHEQDASDLQNTISNMNSQHKEDMDVLNEKLTTLTSCHQSEIKKMQEESNKMGEMKMHFESQLMLVEKRYTAENKELTSLLQEERILKSTEPAGDVTVLVERKESVAQTDPYSGVSGDGKADGSLMERLGEIQAKLVSTQDEHLAALESLRAEHKREFEKAARNREEKFQVELRYFLKDKDDKFKERLDQALRKCEESAKLEFEKAVKEKEIVIEHLKKDLDSAQSMTTNGEDRTVTNSGDKMMTATIEKLNAEKSTMERKIQVLELEKKEELARLQEMNAEQEKALMEKYTSEIEILTLNHSKECKELHKTIKELEDKHGNKSADDSTRIEDGVRKVVNARIQEERARWFRDAHEYIKDEIEAGIAEREQHKDSDDAWTRKLNDEVKRNVDAELEKMKNEMESDKEEEVALKVREQLAQEMNKLGVDREKVEEDKKTIDMKVKQKLSLEIENMKIKFLSELEARVAKEKDQLEQDVKKWKEDMKKKIDGEKKVFVAQITRDMELKVSEERKKVQIEIMQGKQEELRQMRAEMEDEMRRRIEREKMDWQKDEEDWKKRLNEGGRIEDLSAVRNKLRAAEEACNKACTERERAVELLKRRELSYKEDKQKLVAGLKQLRKDLDATKEEQTVLEDKYAQMDRKYKEDMKEAKKKKELALEKLQARCEEEKEKLILDYKNLIASMKEDFCSQMDRVRSEAEIERAALLNEVRSHTERALTLSPLHEPDTDTTTLFELRDHYLETVTKIKEDVMSHVQAANTRAASTMKSEMRKQRRRLIHTFKERCKASIRSILTGQVPPNVLNSLEHAIDLIAEAVVTSPNSTTSNTAAGSPSSIPTSNNSTPRDDRNIDQTRVSGEKHQAFVAASERRDVLREAEKDKHPLLSSEDYRNVIHNDQEGIHPLKYHPQLAKVDLYDSEAIDSSPQTSHHSSPSSIAFRNKSRIHSASKTKSSPPVPRLDFSPFNTPQEAEHPMAISEGQQRRQRADGYLTEVKQNLNRPRSAESRNGPQLQNTPSELQKSGMVKNTDEPSPRDRMKMIEAQVRLANWAASGEMPWKGTGSKRDSSKHKDVDGDEYGKHLFIRPGEEAERFLRAQRTSKKIEGEIVTPMKKDRIERKTVLQSMELDGYVTDDSSMSNGSHSSFVTLEPDANQKSQSNNSQGRNGKGWSFDTKDYDRIKSAVFEHPDRTFVNVTQRREQRTREGLRAPSDDDARSVDSNNPPHYRGLPTSTPAKRNAEEQHNSKARNASKSAPDRRQKSKFLSMQNLASDSDDNLEQESQGWKTVNAFSEFPVSRTLHRERDHEKRSNSQPRPSKSQPSKRNQQQTDNAKSIDFEFPDISEITQASGDVHTGGGMWRYKSLEDLLPHQAKERGPPNQNRNNPMAAGYERKHLSVAKAAAPIQAMNSDFWREQSLENDDDDDDVGNEFGITNYRENLQSKRAYQQTPPVNRNPSKHHSDYDYGRSRNDQFTNSKQMNSKHSAESTWSQKQSHRNPINPSHSSSPHPIHSHNRKKTSYNSTQQNSHVPSYSSHFDAHVDDLRKSLETMEANPFSSVNKHKSKSKMKRSVSEQSLHTIQWDQDKSTDIDDLVNAYTTGGAAMSHFDLHNFGHEEAF